MTAHNKTLVIISPAFPANDSEDYWVPSQQLLVRSLRNNFPRLTIVVLAYFYPYKRSTYEWQGIQVVSFDGIKKNKLALIFQIWKKLKKLKKENHVIGLLSFWCREGAFAGKWFAKWNRLKHLCWICGQDARKTNKYVKWIRPQPTELIAISDFISAEFYKNHKIKPAQVIPNAIDPNIFSLSQPVQRDIDLLAVGSLIPLKRYEGFISIVNAINKHLPGIKAVLCGSGQEKEKISAMIHKLNLADKVNLINEQPHGTVLKLMQRTKILLHPSAYEGFSTACLEALYAGAHVISFTKPMKHDIKNWHIVKTEGEMIERSLTLLQNTQLTHDPVLVYSMDEIANKFMQLLNKTGAQ
jgi:glycosyltransferase involved in cell wall biosynthesis